MSTKRTVRVGIIGAGAIATHGHIPAYQRLPHVQVAALAEINAERGAMAAAKFGIAQVYTDYEKMLREAELDLVSICSPNVFHAPQSLAALQAGCHVLCEKPMALTVAEAEKMVETAHRTGRKLTIGLHYRYRSDLLVVKALIDDGQIGPIYYGKSTYWRREGIPGYGSWFTNKDLAGGGASYDIGVHALDAALWLMGHPEPAAVSGVTYAEFGPRREGLGGWGSDITRDPNVSARCDVDDLAAGFVRFANGAMLTVEVSWAAFVRSREEIMLAGKHGGVEVNAPLFEADTPVRVYRRIAGQTVDITPVIPKNPISSYAQEIEAFVDILDTDVQPVVTPEQGLMTVKILTGMHQSAAEGHEVRI